MKILSHCIGWFLWSHDYRTGLDNNTQKELNTTCIGILVQHKLISEYTQMFDQKLLRQMGHWQRHVVKDESSWAAGQKSWEGERCKTEKKYKRLTNSLMLLLSTCKHIYSDPSS